ncbi:MAG: cobalamin biosynthesis protein CbiG [Methanosaeta sp. PtaB.Bin039]|nr:MAG: cobalamin biosynthesis protein CbiG [Methanosaeta sp. PtaB.Bin039]
MEKADIVVAVMAVGIIVRWLCPLLRDKWTDRPVVAVDSALRCAVPVVGGHHGANELANTLARRIGLFPAVTTATEAAGRPHLEALQDMLSADLENREASKAVNLAFLRKDVPVARLTGPLVVLVDRDVAVLRSREGVVVGLGARKGVSSEEVLKAVCAALSEVERSPEEIRLLATADLKRGEQGMIEAARALKKPLIFLSQDVLNAQAPPSPSRARDLGLCGVAEPAALALAEGLISPKKVYGRVTVALGW